MKALKLIILALLVFAGEKLMAQNVIITNNTWFAGGAAAFHYTSCPILSVPFPPFGSQTQPYTCAANPTQVVVTFNDPSCPPALNPRTVLIPVGSTLPVTMGYIDCNGAPYTFTLNQVGPDWTLDIN